MKLLFITISFCIFASSTYSITISKIKIRIDDSLVVWSGEAIDGFYKTTASYVHLLPGDTMSLSLLNQRVKEGELLLQKSGLYYMTSVMIGAIKDDRVTIFIEVSRGFEYRFGGGNAYGYVGKRHLFSQRKSLFLYGGANISGVKYQNDHTFDTPFITGFSAIYKRPSSQYDSVPDYTDPEISLSAGYRFYPMIDLIASASMVYLSEESRADTIFEKGAISLLFQPLIPIIVNQFSLRTTGTYYHPFDGYKFELYSRFEYSLPLKMRFCQNGSAQFSRGVPLSERPNLYTNEKTLFRGGVPEYELFGDNALYFGSELRFEAVKMTIPPIFNTTIEPYIYVDNGALFDRGESVIFIEAYGGGISILFDNPIFATFSFSYGEDRDHRSKFVFSSVAGFE